jgi:hypothetical protein
MNKIIVGYTGLVGQTLLDNIKFDYFFNSSNINEFESIVNDGDELVLTCLSSNKRIVTQNVKQDLDNINNIINILSRKKYSNIKLISTVDVYSDSPKGSNEDYIPNIFKLGYGSNRYLFEMMIREFVKCDDLKIFRLAALFNKKIKKNVLYDLLNGTPFEINENSTFQWYNLDNLFSDIEYLSNKYSDQKVFNLFNEPIETVDLINLFGKTDCKIIKGDRMDYNYKTKFSNSGYLKQQDEVLIELKEFIEKYDNI